MPEGIKIDVSAYPDVLFLAVAEVAKLTGKIIDTVPAEQHARNWARWERFASWVDESFGIPLALPDE